MRIRFAGGALATVTGLIAVSSSAVGQVAADPRAGAGATSIAGTSTCPAAPAVWAQLETLLPRDRLLARLGAPSETTGSVNERPPIEIVDLGAAYEIVMAGAGRRLYRDDLRDCDNRARAAALYIALMIDPAAFAGGGPDRARPAPVPPPPPPPAPPLELARSASAEAGPTPFRSRLELGAAVASGSDDAANPHPGAELRLVVGRGRAALSLGGLLLLPRDTSLSGVRIRQQRARGDVSVRIGATTGRLQVYGEAGPTAAWLSEEALDLSTSQKQTGIELGARVALGVHAARSGDARWRAFAVAHAEVIANPRQVVVLPRGSLGDTPWLWTGVTAGVSVGLF